MRNFLLVTLLLFTFIPQVQSQTSTVIVSGTVQDASGTAIAGHRLTVWASDVTTFFNHFGTVFTDASGQYADTIIHPTSNNLKIRVSYDSCGRYRQRRFNNVTSNITLNLTVCPPPCRANFSYFRDTSGLVHFWAQDTSFSSYSWNFGSGYTSGGHHTSFQFSSSGIYQVCLATANGTCTDTTCRSIWVNVIPPPPPSCRAAFTYRRDTAGIIHFKALDTTFTSYSWDFGNGNSGTGHHISHQFTSTGSYRVCLATANGTCTDTFCRNIYVIATPPPPTCRTNFTYRRDTAGIVHFKAIDTSFTSYSWNFGGGYATTGPLATHQFAASGIYQVCLATANGTCTDTVCRYIVVNIPTPPPPSCRAVFNYRRDTSGLVHFWARDTSFTSYSWDFGAGYTTAGHHTSHQFASSGAYMVCLATANGTCTDTFCRRIYVNIPPPPPPRCRTSFVIRRDTGGLYHFQALDTSFTSYSWDFGAGYSATGHQVSHLFAGGGTVKVCLATANGSCVDTTCRSFRVVITGPRCSARFTYRRDTTGTIHFRALDTSYTSYSWRFGDGNTATGHSPTHPYASSGRYKVCLVTQNGSCADSFCQDIFVRLPGHTKFFGRVYKDRNFAQAYEVFLIVHDSAAGTLTAIDTFQGSRRHFGLFYFWAPPGDYLVKAALTQSDSNYAQYLPTYYGDSLLWSDATVVSTANRPFIRINLMPGVNPGGPGFTGGLISQGANRQGITMANSDFQASSTLQGDKTTATAITDNQELSQNIKVYPNPAQDRLFVSLELRQSKLAKMTLSNALGQRVATISRQVVSGKQEMEWAVDVPAGVYFLQVLLDGKPLAVQRVIFR